MSDEDYEWFTKDYLNNEKNIGKYNLEEILSQDNLILDTRMSDLRLYVNRVSTLRAHRDGIYYVKNGQIYCLTGEEALPFQGFNLEHIKRVKGVVSNRHLLMQGGNAMTSNVVEAIGNQIKEALIKGGKMEGWKKFELDCVDYLNDTYGNYFEHLGFSDSTTSDIRYRKEDNSFFIEAKMASAQSGQFVLFPDDKDEVFVFSDRNKSELDEHAQAIITYMNDNYEYYKDVGTSGINIDLSQDVFSNWIINAYKFMGVEFLITKGEDYIIFPIEKYSDYFHVSAVYRVKKSGSSRVPKYKQNEVIEYLSVTNIEFNLLDDFKIQSEENLDSYRFEIDPYTYMLSKDTEDTYKVRRLSNTRNANVIFSISLKKSQDKDDLDVFKSRL